MKRPKASDIPDADAIRAVWEVSDGGEHWAMAWLVDEKFPDMPAKVVQAKLSKLMGRGLLDGCDCGCRGDFHLTREGAAVIGVTLRADHARYGGWNPLEPLG